MTGADQNATGESLRRWFEMEVDASLPAECVQRGDEPVAGLGLRVDHCLTEGQPARAAAVLITAFTRLWEEGRDFDKAQEWIRLGEAVLAAGCSGVAAGALTVHLMVAGMLGPANLVQLTAALPRLRLNAGRAESTPIQLLAAAAEVHLRLMRGDLHAAQTVLSDAAHLALSEHRLSIPVLFLSGGAELALALGAALGPRASDLTAGLAAGGVDGKLPLHVRLTLDAHRLLHLARQGQVAEAERLAEGLRSLVIPAQRRHYRSYMHYALGVADLVAGRPGDAVMHASLAMEEGELSGSVAACLIPALLLAQCHLDQGSHQEGLAILDRYEPRWRALGFDLHVKSALLERARCLERQGRSEEARLFRNDADVACPGSESRLPLHRSPEWEKAERPIAGARKLAVAVGQRPSGSCAIEITTLGRFEIRLHGQALPERGWGGGRRATALLCTLIALGGSHVRAEKLCDALWPESDGDQARQNLKVALWRLKRIAGEGAEAVPWLVLLHGEVSLDTNWCEVDALRFQSGIDQAGDAPKRLWSVLSTYSGDFLPEDRSGPVVQMRDRLRQLFVRSTCLAAQASLLARQPVQSAQIELMQRMVSMQPDLPLGYELLMSVHLQNQQVTEAIMVFHHAEQELRSSGRLPLSNELIRLQRVAADRIAGGDRWGGIAP